MPQYARPSSDLAGNSFLNQAASNVNMWNTLDETVADDNDYVVSAKNPSSNVYVCKLTTVSDPLVDGGHVINARYKKDVSVNPETIDLVIQLREGYASEVAQGNLLWTNTVSDIPSSWTANSWTLDAANAASISDYANLSLRFVFNKP